MIIDDSPIKISIYTGFLHPKYTTLHLHHWWWRSRFNTSIGLRVPSGMLTIFEYLCGATWRNLYHS